MVGRAQAPPPGGNGDHFYRTDALERDNALRKLGYRDEGIACHVHTNQRPGACPPYRLFAGARRTNHFYTLSRSERDAAAAGLADTGGPGGGGHTYANEGIAAYPIPHNTATCPG